MQNTDPQPSYRLHFQCLYKLHLKCTRNLPGKDYQIARLAKWWSKLWLLLGQLDAGRHCPRAIHSICPADQANTTIQRHAPEIPILYSSVRLLPVVFNWKPFDGSFGLPKVTWLKTPHPELKKFHEQRTCQECVELWLLTGIWYPYIHNKLCGRLGLLLGFQHFVKSTIKRSFHWQLRAYLRELLLHHVALQKIPLAKDLLN